MAKKDHFLIVDTETTITDKVVDFGAVICDRKGRVLKQCSVLVHGIFGVDALFYITDEDPKNIWSKQGKDRRFTAYQEMLENGTRTQASVAMINRWLERVKGEFDPILTAYNLPFDVDKCDKTAIDLTMFDQRFCLWRAAYNKWGHSKKYLQFVLENHAFNPPTEKGNMSYKTNAEVMARFIFKDATLKDEPHTALEDIIGYELPIFKELIAKTPKKVFMAPDQAYSWQHTQVKDWFQVK